MSAAVLFDMDGTLVDSIPLWEEAYVHALASTGLPVTVDDFLEAYQRGHMRLDAYLDELGFEGDHDEVRRRRDDEYVRLIEDRLTWFDGAEHVLETLIEQGVPVGIVTGSHDAYVEAIDRRLHWRRFTDVCVTVDATGGVQKPDPKGLFMARDALGSDHSTCVYVGDQHGDLVAAKSADMTAVLIRHPHTPTWAETDADAVLDSISELLSSNVLQ